MPPDPRSAVRRRTARRYTAQEVFQGVLMSPLPWPGKHVRLERDSLLDTRERPVSPHPDPAELYHENSKLFPALVPELTASLTDADEVREEHVRRRAALAARAGGDTLDVPPPWRVLLDGVCATTDPGLFHAVELRVAHAGKLARHEPATGRLHVVKHLGHDDERTLRAAARLLDEDVWPEGEPLLAVVVSFARNAVLFGRRGYRTTLLEAGRVVEQVLTQAAAADLALRATTEFADRPVDDVMEVDGVENATLALCAGRAG